MAAQLWTRPWALLAVHRQSALDQPRVKLDGAHRASFWLNSFRGTPLKVNGGDAAGLVVDSFTVAGNPRRLYQPPLPIHRTRGVPVSIGGAEHCITLQGLPDRPTGAAEPKTPEEELALALKLRAEAVWDRLRDVDDALANPLRFWQELSEKWSSRDNSPPQMHIVVEHARKLPRILNELVRVPRRILRRTHQQIPVSRIQEIDRRSMMWLARQPGETLAERAGDRQRLLAVAREENFDTLENRVLHAYVEAAKGVARDYLKRNRFKARHARYRRVAELQTLCKRISRDLSDRGVRVAEAGVIPNFVLQENPRYHAVWQGWKDLLEHKRLDDELWRWQVRSFEEFCALAIMVALVNVPGAEAIATSPIFFRDEQNRGSWVESDNPLGVFYLPSRGDTQSDLLIEVRYRPRVLDERRSHFAAPVWIRISELENEDRRIDVPAWPVWDVRGGLVEEEAQEVQQALSGLRSWRSKHAVVIRPAAEDHFAKAREGDVLSLVIGTEGPALWRAIETLSDYFRSIFSAGAQP